MDLLEFLQDGESMTIAVPKTEASSSSCSLQRSPAWLSSPGKVLGGSRTEVVLGMPDIHNGIQVLSPAALLEPQPQLGRTES